MGGESTLERRHVMEGGDASMDSSARRARLASFTRFSFADECEDVENDELDSEVVATPSISVTSISCISMSTSSWGPGLVIMINILLCVSLCNSMNTSILFYESLCIMTMVECSLHSWCIVQNEDVMV